eukprot:c26509_g1_i1 orf=316-2469(+)
MSSSPVERHSDLESEEDEDVVSWDDWTEAAEDDVREELITCLFCEQRWAAAAPLFEHCKSIHGFDYLKLQKEYALDFYDNLRLINFIRSQVDINKCWSCGHIHNSKEALQKHLNAADHMTSSFSSNVVVSKLEMSQNALDGKGINGLHLGTAKFLWQDDKYLSPFLEDDPLLYKFEEVTENACDGLSTIYTDTMMTVLTDGDGKDGTSSGETLDGGVIPHERDESELSFITYELAEAFKLWIADDSEPINCNNTTDPISRGPGNNLQNASILGDRNNSDLPSQREQVADRSVSLQPRKEKKDRPRVSFSEVAAKERCHINQTYFGSYSAFGIHREMLSDKVRTDAYQQAILSNPMLFEDAVVVDVGCGTGILSLFAAKAGAKKVIAVEASKKMASVAKQVAKLNGYWKEVTNKGEPNQSEGVIDVVQGMIEELDAIIPIETGGADVIVSEWMGYCLLFESMLGSVLHARDRWLRPGGAILPDMAQMFIAGFGRGGTSLPFWEDVYGFDMQCIGQEVMEDAAQSPIIDVLEGKDVVTEACLIHEFDLVNMKCDDVDFTEMFELKLSANLFCDSYQFKNDECCGKQTNLQSNGKESISTDGLVWCYGLVLWFDTGFTTRFCMQNPVILSTSPFLPQTHWSQTLLTFRKPIALSSSQFGSSQCMAEAEVIGTEVSPGSVLKGRISIARSFRHRSIDISLETTVVGFDGAIRTLPVQIFDI